MVALTTLVSSGTGGTKALWLENLMRRMALESNGSLISLSEYRDYPCQSAG